MERTTPRPCSSLSGKDSLLKETVKEIERRAVEDAERVSLGMPGGRRLGGGVTRPTGSKGFNCGGEGEEGKVQGKLHHREAIRHLQGWEEG
ncbi:hypothetical protein IC006_2455 [Sulfuracidifex tepidarius]|uniref:Uncharacterized protein n=1 Tax=Sulfuracidifex tepidarius TaxID=1294262 RepID=A0A510E603_9CREN|nr:hypothetical protein IC006_2455 [Sulfuracidifex tepidarius]BBG27906.1 hypothetical protein IC007_2461 [Sulfuracidifex tepidarius]